MAEKSTSAPEASNHVFLSELQNQSIGAKVRFLCCVNYVSEADAILEVEHQYPSDAPKLLVTVDYDLVRETIKRYDLSIGAWNNVIGYIRSIESARKKNRKTGRIDVHKVVKVQAILIWNAGAIHTKVYEEVLERQKASRSVMMSPST